MKQILIIEDDKALSNGIALAFKQDLFQFTHCELITHAKQLIKECTYDLILLDINLPDGNGFELCSWIRKFSNVPILILTVNDMEMDIVIGLETGADDYLTKPFSLMVLRARVNALLRRKSINDSLTTINIGNFKFDFEKMIFLKNNIKIELSKTEQKLLRLLVINKNITLSREKLIDEVWNNGAEYVEENALSVSIKRLRNKLEDDPYKPLHIKTVYGIGYVWVME
ncbi:response regulator transcription factor [Bacillus sp. JJ722]|uniref:response regulator transcription factor n=1 Tax=Bacillus sp. JJ722 TaxID=3122973 RepID=UPI002FFD64F2